MYSPSTASPVSSNDSSWNTPTSSASAKVVRSNSVSLRQPRAVADNADRSPQPVDEAQGQQTTGWNTTASGSRYGTVSGSSAASP
jgi:hypothetical protein